MTDIDRGRRPGVKDTLVTLPSHTVVVVYGLPVSEKQVGGAVIKLSNQAGMELTGVAVEVLGSKGFRREVFATSRMLLQRPDPSVVEVHYEDEATFVSSRELVDPNTGKGSGRFVTTILTTQDRIEGLELLQDNQESSLAKAA